MAQERVAIGWAEMQRASEARIIAAWQATRVSGSLPPRKSGLRHHSAGGKGD
jgi:hypothetical protein